MANLLGLPECYGYPVREERPTVLEYTAAEFWVRESYRRYFQAEGDVPQIITWQLERFFFAYDTGDPILELTLEMLESDFRNIFTNAIIEQYKSMVKKGADSSALRALLLNAGGGGPRMPDMLGISARRDLVFDSVEVGTVKTAQSTFDELNGKMNDVRQAVIPQIKLRLPALAARHARQFKSLSVPNEFTVRASAFRLKPWEMILPLPVRFSGEGKATTVDWICYHPTSTWAPQGAATANGTDGLVIYHIHRAALPELPATVRRHVKLELEKWKVQQGLVLELNPALAGALLNSKSDWSPEARQLFAYLGIGALVILCVAVAWEVGLIAGGIAIADAGLTALAASPPAVLTALRGTAAVASRLWPAAIAAAPLLPLAQR